MNSINSSSNASDKKYRAKKVIGASALSCAVLMGALSMGSAPSAFAAEPQIDLGNSAGYTVLAGQSVTNTGPSILPYKVGTAPGTSITGFPPGRTGGGIFAGDADATLAQADLTKAYNDAASRTPTNTVSGDLVGQTLISGVYNASSELGLTGTVTLDAQGDPNAVFVFQVGSALTTGSASNVALINGADACNVYWQVGSSATLGTDSNFKGSILALTSISANTNATVEGRALARNGSVTLDSNVFIDSNCAAYVAPVPTPSASPSSPVVTPSASATAAPVAPSSPVVTPTSSPTPSSTDVQVVLPPSVIDLTPIGTTTSAITPFASTKQGELAKTGPESVSLLTGLAAALGMFGAALLFASSRATRLARRH